MFISVTYQKYFLTWQSSQWSVYASTSWLWDSRRVW